MALAGPSRESALEGAHAVLAGERLAEDTVEPQVAAQGVEVGVASEVPQGAVAEVHGALQRGECGVDHIEPGIGAGEVVPDDGSIGQKPDELAIVLEGPVVKSANGQIIGVGAKDIDKQRVAIQDACEKVEFKIALGLMLKRVVRG